MYGEPYHWGNHYFTEGSGSTPDPETGKYFARLHHERYLNQRTRLLGKTTSHKLIPGQVLKVAAGLSGLTQSAEKGILIVRTCVMNVSRDSHYVMEFEAIPYDTKIGFRPALLPRPMIAGTLPARVSSRKVGDTYSFIDDKGRYRVKFNFDLDEWEKGFESVWLRLAKPYSGATYGFHFPLVDGTEVAVGFVEGNPDRPYIAHAMHDSKHPDHVTLNNHTRNVIRTPSNNKIRMEDQRGSEHIAIRTEHGKTQLNLGHLVDNERTARGEGFELRTDNWGSLRAGKGVFISSDVQTQAKGLALDMLPAEDQLTLAAAISEQLASAASNALTHTADTDQQVELKNVLKQLNDAGMLLSAPKGVGIVSPENIQLSSGQRNINLTAGQHTEISTLENFLVVAGKAVSLLAQQNGMNLFANNGKLDIQSQNGPLSMSALQDMSINSVQGKIEISAETEIILKSGGGYIKIANGNVELGTPNNILMKSSGIQKMGPQNLPPIFPFLPSLINSLVKSDGVACSACAAALAEGNPVNPMLGAKVLAGETDLALPGDLSFVISRNYNSYQTDTPAPVGLFGPGWNIASEASLTVRDDAVILHDNSGRSIKFCPLLAGHTAYSPSENLYIVRGGAETLSPDHRLAPLWQTVPDELRRDPQRYFITSNVNGPWWCFEPVYLPDSLQLSGRYVLGQLINQYGKSICYVRQQEGEFAGEVIEIIDGIGRHYQLELLQIEPRMNMQGWGQDRGIRLRAIYLKLDPTRDTLPELPLVRYEYSDRGELTTVYDRAGVKVRDFEYHADFLGRMSAHAYAGRPASQYTYDQSGRVIQQINPFGITYLFEYHPLKTIVRDQLGRQRVYHFAGERGLKRLVKLEQTNRSAQLKTYDIHGRLTAVTDELGRRTDYLLNDETGNIVQLIAPDGKQTTYEYDAQGLRTAVILPNGETLRYGYTAKGQLQSETDPLGNTTRYAYTGTGRLQKIEDANGGKKVMEWSKSWQLARYSDCSGYHTEYQYDEWGQTVQIKGEEGQLTTRRYDAQGRLLAVADAEGMETTYEYNEAGDLLSTRYPDGSVARSSYDALGRPLTYVIDKQTQQVEYDHIGRMVAFIDELGQRTTFEYDNMDRVIRELAFDGREKRAAFNLAGELVYSFDNDNLSEYQYDTAGRLIQTVSKNAARDETIQTQYYYDDLGQLQQADQQTESHLVQVSYQRDAAGLIIQEAQTVATRAGEVLWHHPVQHGYSAHGVRIQTQMGSLPAVNWLTYGSGHILGASIMGNELIEFTRDRLHRERSRRFGYLKLTQTYDVLGRLTQTYQPQIEGIPRYQHYHYDKLHQLIEIQHDKLPHQQFNYDGKGRLTWIKQNGEETRYRFDPAGNREMLPSSANPNQWYEEISLREVRHNRLQQDNDFHYIYDNFGNRIQTIPAPYYNESFPTVQPVNSGNRHEYRYDAQQRLVAFWDHYYGRNRCVEYLYDAFGRRLAKINPRKDMPNDADVIFYGWDGDKLVTTQYNQEKIYTLYEPNSFVPLLRFTQPLNADTKTFPNTIHTYYCDHRGAPTALISKEGKIEWQAEYDVWGSRLNYSKPDTLYQPIRLQGQHYDVESGLYYNRHRYYDPKIGRYINQDPIGLQGGSHLYTYPLNPNQAVDPLGLWFWFLGAGALVGGGTVATTATVGTLTATEVAVLAVVGTGIILSNTGVQANTKAEELTKCLPATPENIKAVVAPSTLLTRQLEVSVPMVDRYTKMIEAGSIPPAVKIDMDVIVEGNHRMVAGLLCNKLPPVDPGFLPSNSITYPFSQIQPNINDWGGY